MTTINVMDAAGATVAIEKPLPPGRTAAAASRPITLSTEDFAAVGATNETAPVSDTATSGLNGRLQRLAQRITSLIALFPAALGQTTKTASLSVSVASDDDLQGKIGSLTETAPATDTASSGLNGRLQRVAQRLTSLIALVPAALSGSGNFKTAISEAIAAGTNTIGAVKSAGPNWTTVWGGTGAPFTSADQHSGVASVTDAPTSGQFLVIDDLEISVDTTMNVTFKCETSGAVVMGPFYILANTTLIISPRGKGRKLATADKKLQVITSVAGNITVDAGYHSEP